jgi:hypothetical protein
VSLTAVRRQHKRTALIGDALAWYAHEPVAYVEHMILRGSACPRGPVLCPHRPGRDGCQRRRTEQGELIVVRPEQADVLALIAEHPRVALRAANGIGKDTLTAWAIEWYLCTHYKAKVPIVSPTGRQVKRTIFSELALWVTRSLSKPNLELMMTNELRHLGAPREWTAFGFAPLVSSTDPTGGIEGIHAEHLLFIITEAKAVEKGVWDAAERMATRPGNKVFCQSVPGIAAGDFFECFTVKARTWRSYHFPSARRVEVEDGGVTYVPTTPLVDDASIQAKLEAGEDSPNFRAGVLAEFLSADPRALIPLAWVEAAHARWRALETAGTLATLPITTLGLDLGFGGSDRTSLAKRSGLVIVSVSRPPGDTMLATGLVRLLADAGAVPVVDAIGASGVVDRLRELGVKVLAFVAGARTDATDRTGELGFVDLRAAAWWGVRERLDPQRGDEIALPPDPLLTADLTAPKWQLTSGGKIRIESKDDIRKRLRRSTDDGDAVVMAFAAELMKGTDLVPSAIIDPTPATYHADRGGGVWGDRRGGRSLWGRG